MFLISILFLLIVLFIYKRRKHFNLLKRSGIDGPKPNLITGNMLNFLNDFNITKFQQYIDEYGKTCGYYMGKKPIILTIDRELIKAVQIKDFSNFTDRENLGIKHGLRPSPKYSGHIISAKGYRWKEVRSILNPTFSVLKLKMITEVMESAIDIFIEKIQKNAQNGNEFDIYFDCQLLTADVISKSALGIDTNVQNDPNNEFFVAAKKLFDARPNKFLFMFMCFPELDLILYPIRRFFTMIYEFQDKSSTVKIGKLAQAAIELRKRMPNKINDLLQIMLDSRMEETNIKNLNTLNLSMEMTENEDLIRKENNNCLNGKKSLTENEVITNAIIFYEAGYETTSTALGFIAHILVTRQDIQDKVRTEVMELFEKEGKFDYNTVNKLSYMQCVINETLRFYPPVTTFVARNTNEDYYYNEIIIPKDATVRIPLPQLHHCEEYWPNHNVFDPERFRDKKIDSTIFQPFGNGPRNCIGMRFALFEIKLTLAKLLFKYKLVPGPSTENELTIQPKQITQTPKYGVFVKAIAVQE